MPLHYPLDGVVASARYSVPEQRLQSQHGTRMQPRGNHWWIRSSIRDQGECHGPERIAKDMLSTGLELVDVSRSIVCMADRKLYHCVQSGALFFEEGVDIVKDEVEAWLRGLLTRG